MDSSYFIEAIKIQNTQIRELYATQDIMASNQVNMLCASMITYGLVRIAEAIEKNNA